VADPVKLTGFLVALRAFVEQTVPGMLVWETAESNGQAYVTVRYSEEGRNTFLRDFSNAGLCYAATPTTFIVSPNDALLRRALDRTAQRQKARSKGKEVPLSGEPWLGKSVGVQAKQGALAVIQATFQSNIEATMERRAWSNIPILNEWRQRYHETSPVAFHQRFWQTKLVCPGGGEYVWNEEFQTMESTVYGHPGQPRPPRTSVNILSDITSANFGLTFENDGLRAQAKMTRAADK
jgi:hypothetical protein